MSKTALVAIAAALVAIAQELDPEQANGAAPETGGEAPAKRRGRPPGSGAATGETTAPTAAAGKTYDELKALIQPLVEAGQGEDVKKVIGKYSSTGLKDIPAKDHAQFEKDLAALSY